jgi:hypothetical protein
MNDLVYPVQGGMEDWAYAASWDPNHTIPCEPTSYGGYDTGRTTYDPYVLRCFNMLVETSDNKIPKTHLGSSAQVLAPRATPGSSSSNGHVTRNLRLALAALDMVQPYVYIETVNNVSLTNDDWQCRHVQVATTVVGNDDDDYYVDLQWVVGGSITVNDVQIYHKKWSQELSDRYCHTNGSKSNKAVILTALPPGDDWQNGTDSLHLSSKTMAGRIDVSNYTTDDEIVVIVRVRVDQTWRGQSHVVNARTNPQYRAEHNGYIVQGRLDWYSVPVLLHKARTGESTTTKELYVRYDPHQIPPASEDDDRTPDRQYPDSNHGSPNNDPTKEKTTTPDQPSSTSTRIGWMVITVIVLVTSLYIGRRIVRSVLRQSRRDQVRNFIYDKAAVTPGLNGYVDIPNSNNGHHAAGELDLPPIA